MKEPSVFATITDDELLPQLLELLRDSRRTEADLVAHVGEVDRRRLYAREASPSMFGYCTRVLHLSGPEAYLRITAARAARKHPVLLAMLADGRLHLSGIAKLAPYLTRDNRDAILSRATHRSKREIEELVAEIAPQPDVPSLIRKLPSRVRRELLPFSLSGPASGAASGSASASASGAAPGLSSALTPGCLRVVEMTGRPEPLAGARRAEGVELPWGPMGTERAEAHDPARPDQTPHAVAAANDARGPVGLRPGGVREQFPGVEASCPRSLVAPLAPARYKVQFTASAELKDRLERLQALLRSEVPDGDLGAVIDRAVTEKLERLEARRYGRTKAPRPEKDAGRQPVAARRAATGAGPGASSAPREATSAPKQAATATGRSSHSSGAVPQPAPAHSRHVPVAIRRAVHERDAGRCRYTDETGRRCPERHRLEYHHRYPFGMGGGHELENTILMCKTHNLYVAELDYGRRVMAPYLRSIEASARPGSGRGARLRSRVGTERVPGGPR